MVFRGSSFDYREILFGDLLALEGTLKTLSCSVGLGDEEYP